MNCLNLGRFSYSLALAFLLVIPTGAMAADFCVSDLSELESAISTAVSNLEADTIWRRHRHGRLRKQPDLC